MGAIRWLVLRGMAKLPADLPSMDMLREETGGIVGWMNVVDCVRASFSPWFTGPHGFVLDGAGELPFRKTPGRLGFFRVEDHP